ncbi:MAG: pyridoxamine 5'-phosphate oxidase family protein [Pseudomonadota bacterium]
MADNELTTIAQRRAFVDNNHTCVVGYTRRAAPPSMSIVHYVMDGDKIVFLTMSERQKAKAVARSGELSICVLAATESALAWPPEYLVLDGAAEIVTDMDYIVKIAMGVGGVMRGEPVPDAAIPLVRDMMVRENRVAICVSPSSSFHSPSVHPDAEDPEATAKMVHGLGARLPWTE